MTKIINLLPKARQQEIRYVAAMRTAWIFVALSVVSFGVVFLVQLGAQFYLQQQSVGLSKQISDLQTQVKKKENAQVKAQVDEANSYIGDFKNLANASPKWSKVIKAFAPLPPAGLKISSFAIDPVAKTISISGQSPTRDLVIQLHNNILADTKDFANINYPLENIAQPTDVSFHFTFTIQDALLQP